MRKRAKDTIQSEPTSGWLAGVVISHLGRSLTIEDAAGQIILCHTRRRLGTVTVGDRVWWEPCEGQQGRVMEILPRKTLLTRPGYQENHRLVAANLDQIAIVIAPLPEPDWLLVDQFLVAAEVRHLNVHLILNKADVLPDMTRFPAGLNDYIHHYPPLWVSVKTGQGLEALKGLLVDRCTLLAGQSGVGKSSLSNALLPDRQSRVGEISERSGLGRHTTTTSILHRLPFGGDLIDSPGVNVFGLADVDEFDLAGGYREFAVFSSGCRFSDCRHVSDKGCAVTAAVAVGHLSRSRHDRYVELLQRLRKN